MLQETRQPAERHPSVIGFVQAPRLLAVDGAMATWYNTEDPKTGMRQT